MSWTALLADVIVWFNYFVLFYFIALNSIYLILFLISLVDVLKFVRRTFFSDYRQIMQSDMTWPISVLIPAHDEEKSIVDTVRSILTINYGELEIIVINGREGVWHKPEPVGAMRLVCRAMLARKLCTSGCSSV
jgi:hypothetical protein